MSEEYNGYIWSTGVTDRELADVQARNDKGTYNYTDLNRVENNTGVISARLTQAGYTTTITTKTDWTRPDIPDTISMGRYLGNVQKCVDNFVMPYQLSLPTSMNRLNYRGANNIEKVIEQIFEMLNWIENTQRYCGTFSCGSPDTLRGYVL